MRISKLLAPLAVLVLLLCRCAAPDTCVRNSDCNDGDKCIKGGCFPDSYDPSTATSSIVSDETDAGAGSDAASTAD